MRLIAPLLIFICLLFFLSSVSHAETQLSAEKPLTSEELGGTDRQRVYVSTDKPIYRAQETVYIRNVVLNAKDNTPYSGNFNINFEILGPKGEVVHRGFGSGEHSTAGVQWVIPADIAGGQYKVVVKSTALGVSKTERAFDVRSYRTPRIKSQIEFTRDGYGPGETVQASVQLTRAEGGIPDGAKITAIARIDGQEVFTKADLSLNDKGIASTEFTLPNDIVVGDGTLSFVIEDGGVVETASKTLPILLQNFTVDFYPEGGDLVAGLTNRIYLQASRADGKPADIEATLVEVSKNKVIKTLPVTVKTQHEGRGFFEFKPLPKKQYALYLDKPAGAEQRFLLPNSVERGAVLRPLKSVVPFSDPIEISVGSNTPRENLRLTLYKSEQRLDEQALLEDEAGVIRLDPHDAEGVLMVTLWSGETPLTERLIYRQPKYALNIQIEPTQTRYVPGDSVELEITATNEQNQPVEAVVGLAVTDDTVLEMVDAREKAPRLPAMVYLEPEVEDLADAQVYLDPENPDAAMQLDLLLGTQGWRRFALVRYSDLLKHNELLLKRLFAFKEPFEEVVVHGIRLQKNRMRGAEVEQQALMFAVQEPARGDMVPRVAAAMAQPVAVELEAAPQFADDRANLVAEDIARPVAPAYVREYAHQARKNRQANNRRDFAETLYWHTGLKTNPRNGKATVKFDLSDNVTSFRVMADGFGRNGALGEADQLLESVEPFYIEPKMPLSVTAGDVVELPVAIANNTSKPLKNVNVLVRAEGVSLPAIKPLSLKPSERGRALVSFTAPSAGEYAFTIEAAASGYSDTVTRSLKVQARGFPMAINQGGLVSAEHSAQANVVIPSEVDPTSINTSVKVYPSPVANMEEALNALLREPNGCFEQTSSTNYPLVMAQQYFTTHQGVSPDKIAQAKNMLVSGYNRLTSFESEQKGYEWFGGNPAHEALTAYGLMQFVDMAEVMEVDKSMVERTQNWLYSRRDGKGGFKRNERALDSFGRAPKPTTDAYIVWSLLESGQPASSLEKEIAAIKEQAEKTEDAYIIALAANIMYLAGDQATGRVLAQRLVDQTDNNGAIAGGKTSITRSGGDALVIETTSLGILAWLKDDAKWAAQVEVAMKWLFERSKAGRFGSTQSTVLALKAINAYDAARAKPVKAGSVQLWLDGKPFGHSIAFDKQSKGAIELPSFAAALGTGEHQLELRMTDGSKMPYSVQVQYNTSLPPSSDQPALTIETRLNDNKIKEGEVTELVVNVKVGDNDAPTPIAIVGIPAGLEVRHDQLKEWVASGRISAYEVRGQEVILYWRALRAEQTVTLPMSLTAAIPGDYTAPASRTYLYYTDEVKAWAPGTNISIQAL